MILKLCRFASPEGGERVGCVRDDGQIVDLTEAGIVDLAALLEAEEPVAVVSEFLQDHPGVAPVPGARLLPPVEGQEIWAAGVTYLRSKAARMEESDFSATAYDRVYAAPRPEVFFKCAPGKAVGPDEAVGIRRDARWSVPEPELALVLNSRGRVAGFTIGNDMSSRDIEGENLLYLPQAKIYDRSCALGPWIVVGAGESSAREWRITIEIERAGAVVFSGETVAGQLRRSFDELAEYLFRSQRFPGGVVLLTGTGIVPPDNFTLAAGDEVRIRISGIGSLRNLVVVV